MRSLAKPGETAYNNKLSVQQGEIRDRVGVKIAAVFADRQEQLGGEGIDRVRLGTHHPGYENLRLHRAERRLLLQAICRWSCPPTSWHNYKDIAAQNVGAALIVRGTVVLTPEAKQPLEVKAAQHRGGGPVHPGLSPAEEAPQRGVPADHPASAAPDQPVLRHVPGPLAWRPMPCMSFSRAGASSMCTPPSSPAATARAPARCSR